MSLLITNGRIITASDDYVADVFCEDGTISAIGRDLPSHRFQADRTIDASGQYVLPGGIDVHTHLDMTLPRVPRRVAVSCLVLIVAGLSVGTSAKNSLRTFRQIWGRNYQPQDALPPATLPVKKKPVPAADTMHRLQHWNRFAIDMSGVDHTPLAPGETDRVYGEQLGPGRASRAMTVPLTGTSEKGSMVWSKWNLRHLQRRLFGVYPSNTRLFFYSQRTHSC